MKESTASDDILLAMKKIMWCQLLFGLFAIIFEIFSSYNRGVNIESALIGVILAILPGMFGMFLASRKAKFRPDVDIKDLMQLSGSMKLVYTVISFALVFHFFKMRNVVMITSYSITFLGYFVAPLLYKYLPNSDSKEG
ncbi:hypothetical protein VIOR3934_07548 [Vibrio orientalis CIP 102891 = ATCC 33934]|uniref:ATP synthase subunit I n=1 Tax=Vibrio orientalis CIP 102891 = ATCC 33934 TaxID=675816 RepID=F9SXN5_VIBOR|nr:hypothetical protein [Vibrio orientalis]EGU46590.1 hypothetical protein VIOR3934_07548 [Vibrio orientalis CIP 102891 = ATCC 33934]